MSKTCALFHVVICTKYRKFTIPEKPRHAIYRYITGILANHRCKLLRINGIGNHMHILFDMATTVTLAQVMQSIKQSTSRMMLRNPEFPLFEGWSKEYFAFSVSPSAKMRVIEYINNQEKHHTLKSLDEEMDDIYRMVGFES